jgi:hypothetical protein
VEHKVEFSPRNKNIGIIYIVISFRFWHEIKLWVYFIEVIEDGLCILEESYDIRIST